MSSRTRTNYLKMLSKEERREKPYPLHEMSSTFAPLGMMPGFTVSMIIQHQWLAATILGIASLLFVGMFVWGLSWRTKRNQYWAERQVERKALRLIREREEGIMTLGEVLRGED